MKAWPYLLLLVLPACASSRPTDDDASDRGSGGTSGSGGSSGTGGGAHDPSTLDGFFAALCASEAPCCVEGGFSADPAECLSFFRSLQVDVTYDAAKGADCVEWLRASTRDYTICLGTQTPPASCDDALVAPQGERLPGDTCSTPADCAPSTEGEVDCHLELLSSTTTMKCQLQIRGKAADAPCLGTRDDTGTSGLVFEGGAPARGYICNLADGLYCDGTACAPTSPVGGPCDETHLCDNASYCDFGAGACVARRALTAPCDADGQCLKSLYCNPENDACATRLATGAACTDSAQCASSICSNGSCYADDAGLGLDLICLPR